MRNKKLNLLLILVLTSIYSSPICAESLFKTGISDNFYVAQPRPLFSSVKARAIGDIVTINVNEEVNTSDSISYVNQDSSTMTDNFRNLWNKILPGKIVPDGLNGYGGSTDINKVAASSRKSVLKNTITAQVVQILPNGNLLVQGKKTSINAKERVEVILSGIVDPRLLDERGGIDSNLIANLQIAVVGKGSISRSESESPVSKYVRYLF